MDPGFGEFKAVERNGPRREHVLETSEIFEPNGKYIIRVPVKR